MDNDNDVDNNIDDDNDDDGGDDNGDDGDDNGDDVDDDDEDDELFKNETTENIMYISPNLIKQITKTDDFGSVKKLNLSIAKQWKRKIQVSYSITYYVNEKIDKIIFTKL